MKSIILVFVLILPVLTCTAGERKREAITELLQFVGTREMMDSMRKHAVSATEELFRSQPSPYKGHPYYERIVKRVMEKFDAKMKVDSDWAKWEPFIVELYNSLFTEKQISELSAFYRTETGQASLRAVPQIMGAVQVHWSKTVDTSQEVFDKMISDAIEELSKEMGYDK
jgi:uncharacterized protein